jgi:hypothetical protein
MGNPDEADLIVAYPPEIGWIHQDDDSIREFDIDDANWIIQNNGGVVHILIDEEAYDQDGTIYTITEDQEVIMKYQFDNDEDQDWDEYLEE